MLQSLDRDVVSAAQAASERSAVDAPPRLVQPRSLLLEPAFACERHLLHLHRVEP